MSDAAEIEARLQVLGDWRADVMRRLRQAILTADADVVEEIKWRKPSNPHGVPTYAHGGLIGTLEVYKDKVKFTFNKGAALPEPKVLRWLGAGTRRAIDIFEADPVDETEFAALFMAAVALNRS